jgi:VanZ family protein
MLAATSWAEIYLPGRSAEITDTLMAVFLGAILVLIEVQERLPPKSSAI